LRGRELPAIVEGPSPESDDLLQGRLIGQAPEVDGRLLFSDGTGAPGDLVRVTITKTYAFDLVGDIVGIDHPAVVRRNALLPSLPVRRLGTGSR
jgi:tRNA A37 methylthiotransferase MiaB